MGNNTYTQSSTPKLCIHCGDTKTPCPYRDGIMCKGYICARDNKTPDGKTADFSQMFNQMFGGFGGFEK